YDRNRLPRGMARCGIAGCETGFVTRIGNSGTQRRPVFEPYTFMCQGGKPIELLNGPFSDPGSFMEASIGQTAPTCIDWDLDGALDLLVVAGDRLVWYRNRGTSSAPDWAEPVEVTAEDGSKVHKHRNKPAIVDWDGDGLPDIIGHDPRESRLLWFRRYRDEQSGELKLASGVPLLYADGSPVEPRAWHRYTKFFNAADWKGKGSNDLFLSTCDLVLYLENVGTNEAPRFLPPVRLAVDGIPVVIGHHVSTPQPVDWDLSGALDLLVSGESGLFHLFRRACLDGVHRRLACTIV
ncbi:MAG: VCBS repeat-containing protein, partial [Paenibacillaceae bacterium]|nr:VCBS repeat-containing protein [Paenibacillaceae bacterium]